MNAPCFIFCKIVQVGRKTSLAEVQEKFSGVNGGAKAGQRQGCGADMEMAPIGAISMSAAMILIRV
ncbi:hypothetical protein LJR098_002675 [Rhizobium sp. LjRoot98]|uniref:hypothetical protein n=1 Tax=Rhizobium sp. LjRoot98 TaxID=3342345 RepID=UPI003ECD52C6